MVALWYNNMAADTWGGGGSEENGEGFGRRFRMSERASFERPSGFAFEVKDERHDAIG
jgi:hypothetical protein